MTNEQFYTETLKEYKTTASKKAFLTRSRNQVNVFLTDQVICYNGSGYYLGERVTAVSMRKTRNELIVINRLYANLEY